MGLAYLITSDRLQLLCERKVLKEAEYAALLDAGQLIETARAEAARITEAARRDAARVRREAHAQGLREGQAEAATQLLALTNDAQARLGGLREMMAQLVVKAVGQIVADTDPALLFERALLRIQGLLNQEVFASVRVAPSHEAALRAALVRLQGEGQVGLQLGIQTDPTLAPDGCILQTPSGTLDIGIGAQLKALARALRATDGKPGAAHE